MSCYNNGFNWCVTLEYWSYFDQHIFIAPLCITWLALANQIPILPEVYVMYMFGGISEWIGIHETYQPHLHLRLYIFHVTWFTYHIHSILVLTANDFYQSIFGVIHKCEHYHKCTKKKHFWFPICFKKCTHQDIFKFKTYSGNDNI